MVEETSKEKSWVADGREPSFSDGYICKAIQKDTVFFATTVTSHSELMVTALTIQGRVKGK
jgi:hypothetical protein